MKKTLSFLITFLVIFPLFASQESGEDLWITFKKNSIKNIAKTFPDHIIYKDSVMAVIKTNQLDHIATLFDGHKNRGFIVHSTKDAAQDQLNASTNANFFGLNNYLDYTISEQQTVLPLLANVSEKEITKVIKKLSSYKDRYHRSNTGKQSQQWIKDYWQTLFSHRNDVKVEYFNHKRTKQPSVILTLEGLDDNSNEIIILGGHADTIRSSYFSAGAPGADDNASGIATLSEILRVLSLANFKPKRTVQFMAYAAEEVGLVGSGEIAGNYKKNQKNVVGILQYDMTNYNGSAKDLYLIDDNTNKEQNNFLGMLLDKYLKISWGYTKCGYGCSDHASWHRYGYPASYPFESTVKEYNPQIHTKNDTLAVTNGSSQFSVNFVKLGLAFIVEMAK